MKSFCLTALFILSFSLIGVAQDEVASVSLESVGVVPSSAFTAFATNTKQFTHRGFTYYFNPRPRSVAEATLWGGYTVDMVSTVKNVTHPQWYVGFDATDSVFYNKEGRFTEGGWAKFLGNRNAPAIVSANFLLDWGIMAINRRINIKAEAGSRRWRIVKRVSNSYVLAKGLQHIGLGIYNFRDTANQANSIEASNPGGCWRDSPVPPGGFSSTTCK